MRKHRNFKSKLSYQYRLKLALSNFLERKWRNIVIALATSIGFIGIFISFGLGNAIVNLINSETDGGKIPAQVQISLNTEVTGTSIMTQEDLDYIKEAGGSEGVKYLESPFSVSLTKISMDDKEFDLLAKGVSYSQLTSLYEDTSIYSSVTDESQIVAGEIYSDVKEIGLTIPETLLKDWNELYQTELTSDDILGKNIVLTLSGYKSDSTDGTIVIETSVVRVVKDEFGDGTSNMSVTQLGKIIEDSDFIKLAPYVIAELNNPDETDGFIDRLKENKRYRVMSQQEVLKLIITFIRVIQGLLIVLSFQAIIVSMVMIGIIININILQRSREIGVMKAVGYDNKAIQSIFTQESVLITMISFFISWLVSQGFGGLANVIVNEKFESLERVFELDVKSIGTMLILSLLIGYLSAYFPTRNISKLDPVESLRYE